MVCGRQWVDCEEQRIGALAGRADDVGDHMGRKHSVLVDGIYSAHDKDLSSFIVLFL